MRATILWYSYRPGGIDILCDSLKRQTYQNYELIMVDDYTERRQKVKKYLSQHGIHPDYLGPSKKKSFPNIAFNCTNALNTGILMSTGDPIIVLTDYIWMPPKAIERFMSFEEKYKKNWCITTAGNMWEKQPYDLANPISVFSSYWSGDPLENKCRYLYSWVPEKWEMSFSAIPYNVYKKTNGCPECWDCLTSLIDDINEKKAREDEEKRCDLCGMAGTHSVGCAGSTS
jgi:glycosyltransferase involved in cell wall biosynthesis